MTAFYEAKQLSTFEKLKSKGFEIQVRYKEGSDAFNAVTGGVTAGAGSSKKSLAYGILMETSNTRRSPESSSRQELVLQGMRKVMMSSYKLPKAPTIDDVLFFGNKEYKITAVEPFAPGNEDLFYNVDLST